MAYPYAGYSEPALILRKKLQLPHNDKSELTHTNLMYIMRYSHPGEYFLPTSNSLSLGEDYVCVVGDWN